MAPRPASPKEGDPAGERTLQADLSSRPRQMNPFSSFLLFRVFFRPPIRRTPVIKLKQAGSAGSRFAGIKASTSAAHTPDALITPRSPAYRLLPTRSAIDLHFHLSLLPAAHSRPFIPAHRHIHPQLLESPKANSRASQATTTLFIRPKTLFFQNIRGRVLRVSFTCSVRHLRKATPLLLRLD